MATMKFFNVLDVPVEGAVDGTYYVKDGDYIDTYLVSSGKVEKLSAESLRASYDGRVTQVESDLAQLENDVIQKSSTLIGDNLFNPNYVPVGEQLWMKGGDGTLIIPSSIVANASFYTTPIIRWGDASKMITKNVRSYVQLDGLFNPIAFYYPSFEQSNYVITKEANAKYIKICCGISSKPTNIVNYGETLIRYRPYRENKVYNPFSNTEVTDREIIDIKNRIKTFNNIVIGNNLFNPYYSPISNEEWAKGGINTLINDIGLTVSSAGWYTTSLVEWKENSTMFAKRYRSWVQLNEYMDVIAVDFPLNVVNNQQISKSEGAKYIKISVPWSHISNLKLEMLNYGSAALPYEEYHEENSNSYTGYDYTDYHLRLKEYIINESFTVPSATYDANGVIVSPLNVLWADGGTGQLTITRNSNFNITKILATYLKNDVSINMTLNINRDINDNVTSVTF